MATAAAQAGFGAASGSSLASAVAFTKISLPPMLSRGYDKKLAAGTIAAAGILAVLIPPSALVVIYGIIAEQPISPLLIAGVIPGLLACLGFMAVIFIRAKSNPAIAPMSTERVPWREKVSSLRGVWGLLVLILIVIGGIYAGVFTPTEAGAAGCFGAFLIALQQRRLGQGRLKSALLDALSVTAMVFFVLTAALVFGRFLAVTKLPDAVLEFVQGSGWPPMAVVICFMAILLVMGMFMEATSAIVLSMPIMVPTIESLGLDGVWFGILVVYTLAVGFVTPPIGIVAFAVKGSAGGVVSTGEVFRGVMPFVAVAVVLLALLLAFPEISLVLPNMMK
jgi:tripartite ATP-independent transporter DctM subunit